MKTAMPVLRISDYIGACKVRCGIGRMRYAVEPGIYSINQPDADSPVLVSANYKLSFDHLRSKLVGISAWILVLDTKAVNVWCAAGKETFGTEELVSRIESSGLADLVHHRNLIVPQLGAVGICAHEVRNRSGFSVIYGPVRAADIKAFLDSGCQATEDMRRVRFPLYDRLVVTPVEFIGGLKYLAIALLCFFALAGFSGREMWREAMVHHGFKSVLIIVAAYVAGTCAGPALLPWLPGRSFSFKGAVLGAFVAAIVWITGITGNWMSSVAWLLIIGAICSYLVMNFTGCSTYTSLSGVKKEMRIAVPLQIIAAVLGTVSWVVLRLI
jgi:acetyl-CoA decarbonylase/synthase complex subunit gamma